MTKSQKRMDLIRRYKADAESLTQAELIEVAAMYHDLAESTSRHQMKIAEALFEYTQKVEKIGEAAMLSLSPESSNAALADICEEGVEFADTLLKLINSGLDETSRITQIEEKDLVDEAVRVRNSKMGNFEAEGLDLSKLNPFQLIKGGQEDN